MLKIETLREIVARDFCPYGTAEGKTRAVRLKPENWTPETRLSEVGIDSLDLLELAMTIEEELECDTPAGAEDHWKTFGDVLHTYRELP